MSTIVDINSMASYLLNLINNKCLLLKQATDSKNPNNYKNGIMIVEVKALETG